jgi:hypothetical protein
MLWHLTSPSDNSVVISDCISREQLSLYRHCFPTTSENLIFETLTIEFSIRNWKPGTGVVLIENWKSK